MASTINFLRLLADPTRLRLLCFWNRKNFPSRNCRRFCGMGQSRISSHLAQLKRAGVVEDRRAGKNVYYGLTNKAEHNPTQRLGARDDPHARARNSGNAARSHRAETDAAQTPGRGARVFRPARGKIRTQSLPWPFLAGARTHADHIAAAAHSGGSWRRGRNAVAIAREKRAQSDRCR